MQLAIWFRVSTAFWVGAAAYPLAAISMAVILYARRSPGADVLNQSAARAERPSPV